MTPNSDHDAQAFFPDRESLVNCGSLMEQAVFTCRKAIRQMPSAVSTTRA